MHKCQFKNNILLANIVFLFLIKKGIDQIWTGRTSGYYEFLYI